MLTLLFFSQVIVFFIALVFFIDACRKFFGRERHWTWVKFVFYIIIWGSVAVFSIAPKLAQELSHALGLGENLNTFIFVGFVIIFVSLVKLINSIDRLDSHISEIIRHEALEKLRK